MGRIIGLLQHLFEEGFEHRILGVHVQQGSDVRFGGVNGLDVPILVHVGNGFQFAVACVFDEHYFFLVFFLFFVHIANDLNERQHRRTDEIRLNQLAGKGLNGVRKCQENNWRLVALNSTAGKRKTSAVYSLN